MKIKHTLLHFVILLSELLSVIVVRNSTGYLHITKWNTGEESCLVSHFLFTRPGGCDLSERLTKHLQLC